MDYPFWLFVIAVKLLAFSLAVAEVPDRSCSTCDFIQSANATQTSAISMRQQFARPDDGYLERVRNYRPENGRKNLLHSKPYLEGHALEFNEKQWHGRPNEVASSYTDDYLVTELPDIYGTPSSTPTLQSDDTSNSIQLTTANIGSHDTSTHMRQIDLAKRGKSHTKKYSTRTVPTKPASVLDYPASNPTNFPRSESFLTIIFPIYSSPIKTPSTDVGPLKSSSAEASPTATVPSAPTGPPSRNYGLPTSFPSGSFPATYAPTVATFPASSLPTYNPSTSSSSIATSAIVTSTSIASQRYGSPTVESSTRTSMPYASSISGTPTHEPPSSNSVFTGYPPHPSISVASPTDTTPTSSSEDCTTSTTHSTPSAYPAPLTTLTTVIITVTKERTKSHAPSWLHTKHTTRSSTDPKPTKSRSTTSQTVIPY